VTKGQIVKAKTTGLQGQGLCQTFMRTKQRSQFFVLELFPRSKAVLQNPIFRVLLLTYMIFSVAFVMLRVKLL